MDSGNSGSVQSPSGGSEEFDSRTESISSFFNNNPSSHMGHGPLGGQQPPPLMDPLANYLGHPSSRSPQPPPLMERQQSILFDPLANYLGHPSSSSPQLANNPNSLLNLDTVWSKNLRSDPNCNDLGRFMASSAPTQQLQSQSRPTFSSMQIPQEPENGTTKVSVSGTTTDQPNNNTNNNNNNMVRNSKKRSRASRRAPTTVLTTDTTNFRAMVQEFTGIPAPPCNSSPFQRTRLDLFGTPSSTPHYLLRPFAQNLHCPPSFTMSSMVDAIASTPSTNSSSTSINYHQLPSELGLLKQPQNPLNMQQNPILNYVSLLQTPPKYPIPSNDHPPLKMGVFEDFGLSHGHGNTHTNNLSGFQNMVSSLEATGSHSQQHDQSLLRSINGSYNNSNTQRVTNGANTIKGQKM